MATVATIEIENSEGTLFVDILNRPPSLAIRRAHGGVVLIEARELRHLTDTLILAAGDLAALAAEAAGPDDE